MKTERLALLAACFLVACATAKPDASREHVAPESAKLRVMQVEEAGTVEFVACGECPQRTRKVIALMPETPKTAPAVEQRKPVPAVVTPAQRTYKVHFRWGYAVLDAEGRRELDAVVSEARKTGGGVTILGRTDPTGSRKWNQRLARKRAEAIKKDLIAAGIPAAAIKAAASSPCCDGDVRAEARVHREQRRTDVEIMLETPR